MTANIEPISDEALAELEKISSYREPSFINQKVCNGTILSLIARLRAAELSAKRWSHARRILSIEAIQDYQREFDEYGMPGDEAENVRADQAIDAAMEPNP